MRGTFFERKKHFFEKFSFKSFDKVWTIASSIGILGLKKSECPSDNFRNKDMLVVLLCCMMKIVEFSTGKPLKAEATYISRRKRFIRKRKGKCFVSTEKWMLSTYFQRPKDWVRSAHQHVMQIIRNFLFGRPVYWCSKA